MEYEVEIHGRLRRVALIDAGDGFAVAVDGRSRHVDAARIDAHTVSLLIGDMWPKGDTRKTDIAGSSRVRSVEVAISRDRAQGSLVAHVGAVAIPVAMNGRRHRKDDGSHAAGGPQRIVAPMPGKIVRVLVQTGEVVRSRQPLIVIEAMKMENELRASGDGRVTRLHVKEGDSVEAGAQLVVIA